MKLTQLMAALAVPLCLGSAALAQTIEIEGAYARTSFSGAPAGAAFMTITNTGTTDDRLVAARSDAAARVELHTHIDAGDGVMQMREVEDGFPLPAGGAAVLERGGDHVMFMGIGAPWEEDGTVNVTLIFESGEEITLDLPIRIGNN
ncbi:copper chaperone PCu(A)C [Ponticoccus sp. SC2-23]|uniref:copper chaperone PCu(A)C n=1 Tax=Alexandriicola marinus TaxID=2081710 RepID=UPI000FD93F11|nr:copper chaperone PCu(A)C [Alexandriicola marinus]MBM1221220.1 copper chaperone PCu(A)C [Ponticoccus sp. SC6-9]MBM1225790.1 copper chaperone PCu(A)C [Ponticoccus sp. SC6-15]MBM1227942.1 copper chaperone PCu(A)C [Ponticoccus sp. SC6-38]MBM1234420.1 copper chaperone PCu(A)C [Ponticoccus sp. SC6-45]MBM1238444.1 copper chaperone PCu(A)C [Ponticoccus sp. SC6-49]MBM1243713.1 copper chaperone PCu(A)C [Ponticoccus sp. SC2-64]MBM1247944.1 copper chaperone PCu(A)C [Ponticoccus sp. SC6-42]MBM1252844